MHPDDTFYADFGFPLCNMPQPDHAVTDADLSNVVKPLLRGCEALLSSLVEAIPHSTISPKDASAALALVAGQLAMAVHMFDRWEQRSPTTSELL